MAFLEVGTPAPDLGLAAPVIAAAARRARPRVLAFVRDWNPPSDAAALDDVRAQLRGLGAELLVLSGRCAWSFRPDDALELIVDANDVAVAAAAQRYGVRRDRDAVFVIGSDSTIRFAHVPDAPVGGSLVAALESAVEAMAGRRTPPVTFNRREWVTSCLVSGFALALFAGCRSAREPDRAPPPPPDPADAPAPPIHELDITLDVNGTAHQLTIDPRTSLLDALRERLALTGTKKGCDGGQCGACTVHVGGQRVVSCLTLAAVAEGQPIKTIEGLGTLGALHPMQAAFVEHDAFQCGFCTPGQIMSAVALLAENRAHTDDEVREHMSGNLCRCGAYPNIIAAVRAARRA